MGDGTITDDSIIYDKAAAIIAGSIVGNCTMIHNGSLFTVDGSDKHTAAAMLGFIVDDAAVVET